MAVVAVPAVAVALEEAITAAIVFIVGLWTIKNAPEITLPQSSPHQNIPTISAATASEATSIIEGVRGTLIAEAASISAKNCCPPCVPPVGTVCVYAHMYYTGTRIHSPCVNPPFAGHLHIKIRKMFFNRELNQCGCTWHNLDPICIPPGFGLPALMASYFTEGNPNCAEIKNQKNYM